MKSGPTRMVHAWFWIYLAVACAAAAFLESVSYRFWTPPGLLVESLVPFLGGVGMVAYVQFAKYQSATRLALGPEPQKFTVRSPERPAFLSPPKLCVPAFVPPRPRLPPRP